MMVLKKYENKVGKKTTSPDLNSFLKITALLEKKKKSDYLQKIQVQMAKFCLTSKWNIFPTMLLVYQVKQGSLLRNFETLYFIVNFSNPSFFSSEIKIKTLREEASSYLTQNIISPNSYTKSIVEKAQAWPWQVSVTWRKSMTLAFPDLTK